MFIHALIYHTVHFVIRCYLIVKVNLIILRRTLITILTSVGDFAISSLGFHHANISKVKQKFLLERKKLRKIPNHVAVIVVEDSVSLRDLVKVAYWSISLGTQFLTFYDKNGRIKSDVDKFESFLQNDEMCIQSGCHIKVHSKDRPNGVANGYSSMVHINVLGPEDCRSDIVNATKEVCHDVLRKKIKPQDINIDTFPKYLQANCNHPDPDMIISFGLIHSLLGFLPWHIRVTEMFYIDTHYAILYEDVYSVYQNYAEREQRLGR